jgi:hypothetical protein
MSSVDATSDIDLSIHQLLDQQADIQARLASLLSAQHGFNPPLELGLLRYKLDILENVASHYGMCNSQSRDRGVQLE